MKIILTMASSLNGFIATKTGDEDFLSNDNWKQFLRLANKIGCFIWGRKTYESVIKWEGDYLSEIENVEKVIISKSSIKLKEGFILAHSPEDALQILKKKGFDEAIITGGANINSEFAKRGLINEVMLNVNPVILGEGVPIFSPADFDMKLNLLSTEKVSDNILQLHYKVIN